jgi:predicted RNA-binding Zn ribbon-like protein
VVRCTRQIDLVVRTISRRNDAPGDLEIVRNFINTFNVETGADDLTEPADLRSWLADNGLMGRREHVDGDDLTQARAFREALRDMAGRCLTPADRAVLDEVGHGLAPRFGKDGDVVLEACGQGCARPLERLLGIAVTSVITGEWQNLKTCRAETCRWAFYDNTRNHSAVWCDMAVCGSRAKSRASYQRRKATIQDF